MRRFARLILRNQRGNAAAETVLLLPLLTVLLFGGMEFGHFYWTEHQVIKAVRDGARFAGRQGFDDFDCSAVTDAGVEAAIQKVTRTGFVSGNNPEIDGSDNPLVRDWSDDSTVTVSVECISGEDFSGSGIYKDFTESVLNDESGEFEDESIAKKVIVSAEVDYPALFGGFAFLDFLEGYQLTASAESPVMGF